MLILSYFKALADTTRIRIYHVLLEHELSVNELVTLLGTGQSRVSHHIKILVDAGLLSCRKSGVWSFYSSGKTKSLTAFNKAVKILFNTEPDLLNDLEEAKKIISGRKAVTQQFFNNIAEQWDCLKKEILGTFDINNAIISDLSEAEAAVDLGCGTGELMEFLLKKNRRVIGVDSSQKMLEEAKKRFDKKNITADLRLGELEHLPMKDSEADLAVISLALHHLSNPEDAVKESARVLKSKGRLVIAEFGHHGNETLRKKYGDRWLGLPEEDVTSWLENSGFILESIKNHDLQKNLTINIYTALKTK